MDRKQFIEICDSKLKMIRIEFSYSQEKMALILGISKKTLVEIEKGRSSLGRTVRALRPRLSTDLFVLFFIV
jgi:DNA-binding XRE family transcriptional regulator